MKIKVLVTTLFVLGLVIATPVSAAKTGVYNDGFPPNNDGSRHGAGSITEDVTNDRYIFLTPQDATLSEGDAVTFDVWHGRVATDVQLAGDAGNP